MDDVVVAVIVVVDRVRSPSPAAFTNTDGVGDIGERSKAIVEKEAISRRMLPRPTANRRHKPVKQAEELTITPDFVKFEDGPTQGFTMQ
jgi:hypothetical protein